MMTEERELWWWVGVMNLGAGLALLSDAAPRAQTWRWRCRWVTTCAVLAAAPYLLLSSWVALAALKLALRDAWTGSEAIERIRWVCALGGGTLIAVPLAAALPSFVLWRTTRGLRRAEADAAQREPAGESSDRWATQSSPPLRVATLRRATRSGWF